MKVYGPAFRTSDGTEWSLMLFPFIQIERTGAPCFSCFLHVANAKELREKEGTWWARDVDFTLRALNFQQTPAVDTAAAGERAATAASGKVFEECSHKFTEREVDWGFRAFLNLEEALGIRIDSRDQGKTLIIRVWCVRVRVCV